MELWLGLAVEEVLPDEGAEVEEEDALVPVPDEEDMIELLPLLVVYPDG